MPYRRQSHVVPDHAGQFKSGPRLALLVLLGAAIGLFRLLLVEPGRDASGLWDGALVIGIHIYLVGLFPLTLAWAFPRAGVPNMER